MKTSVALCTYNGEKYLREQLDSILNQTSAVDEIIVCDDRSTDNTVCILEEYQSKFPNLFFIYINEANLNSTKNFQKALNLCQNEVVFLSDQDDVWHPNKVHQFIKTFEDYQEIKVVASNGNYYDGDQILEDKISVWDIPNFIKKNSEITPNYFELTAAITNVSTGAAMAIKKEFIAEIPEFPNVPNVHHDEYIALIAARKQVFYFLDEKLFNYRIHQEQQVGINFFDFDVNKLDYLLKPYKKDKSFRDYKQLLKVISVRHQFYKDILANNSLENYYEDLFRDMKEICRLIFLQNKKEMYRKYPLQARFLRIVDLVTKKRRL